MILPQIKDAPHKYQMYRLLTAILKDPLLSKDLIFKGGTCASLRGWLDRFSVDLDFDLKTSVIQTSFRPKIHQLVKDLDFEIKDQSQRHLQFFLKYEAPKGERNTLKLEINDDVSPHNESEIATLDELNLSALTQTQSTMVACKLVAALNRFYQHQTIAGRDFYDLHYFLSHGFPVNAKIIEERMNQSFSDYLKNLIEFIGQKVSDKDLYEDLNPLLPSDKLTKSIPTLKSEIIFLLKSL